MHFNAKWRGKLVICAQTSLRMSPRNAKYFHNGSHVHEPHEFRNLNRCFTTLEVILDVM